MGAPKKADWREERRKRAWHLKEQGWLQKDIAVALGVSEGAVSQWLKRGRTGGLEALNAHPPKGVAPRLTAEQKAQIPGLLAKGAEAYGFRGDVWTANRVVEVIDRTFGVRYHRDHVGRILREAGWSRQQPIERATQRNEQAIKDWYEKRWPALKKNPRGGTDHRLGRRSGLLLAADGRAHLGTTRPDAHPAGAVDARSSLGYEWHHLRWPTVHASASCLLRCRSRRAFPAGAPAQDYGQTGGDLGRLADPSWARDQRLSQTRGGQTFASGTTSGLRP